MRRVVLGKINSENSMRMVKLRYFLTTKSFGLMNLRLGCDLMAEKPSYESGTITTLLKTIDNCLLAYFLQGLKDS